MSKNKMSVEDIQQKSIEEAEREQAEALDALSPANLACRADVLSPLSYAHMSIFQELLEKLCKNKALSMTSQKATMVGIFLLTLKEPDKVLKALDRPTEFFKRAFAFAFETDPMLFSDMMAEYVRKKTALDNSQMMVSDEDDDDDDEDSPVEKK